MMKIGIIGAENSHAKAIAKTINAEKKVRGCSIEYIWGEKKAFAESTAKEGRIPTIVSKSTDMLDKIDALIVDHRHAKHHLDAALPYIKAGIPAFIDKPFCYRSANGKKFLSLARRKKVPVCSFSTIPMQQTFVSFTKKLAKSGAVYSGTTWGPADLKNKYGGIFFYGIHQVETALRAFGYNVSQALITKGKAEATGQLLYSDGKIVTLNLIKSAFPKFHIAACTESGMIDQQLAQDSNPYLAGIKTFTKMFRTGKEPDTHDIILKPVQVLEALERSLKSGKMEKVKT